MQIQFDPKALDYITHKVAGKTITLEATEKPGGDEHNLSFKVYPSIVKGKSKEAERNSQNYDEQFVEGIHVYCRTRLFDNFKTLTIKTQKILFITMLFAETERI